MLSVNIEIKGDTKVIKELSKIKGFLTDWRDEFETVGEKLISFYKTNVFTTSGGAIGMPWAPLSPAYQFSKSKLFSGAPILVATGKLQGGFSKEVGETFLHIKNSATYFNYHDSDEPRKKLPQRKIVKVTKGQVEEIAKVFKTGIENKIKKAVSS